MTAIDWWVIAAYLGFTIVLGLWLARRASGGLVDFFVSGRSLPWWLAGTSMAATTFSVDTPLYVAGLVARRGIAGNWEWWAFAFSHLLLIYLFARLWRRAEVVTDVELTEIRYGGRPAAILRGTRAFLFAVPINCIAIGYVMLAMRKVIEALGLLPPFPAWLPGEDRLWAVVGLCVFVLVYAGLAGLWGVVATDFFQFLLAMTGALLVAGFAVADIGGLAALKEQLVALGQEESLRILPRIGGGVAEGGAGAGGADVGGVASGTRASLPLTTFLAYLGIQWWAFRRSDGGGEFVQRLSACRTEEDAHRAAWLFNVLHYVVRAWPWIVAGLAAMVIFPNLEDPELGYPLLMLEYLPAGLLGLVVASFLAAFMSTVSTQINWGASYLVNDLYARFVDPEADDRALVALGRAASVLIVALAGIAAFVADDIGTVFRFMIAIGTGPGAVLILRWFWWRVNAWTELAAMVAGFLIAVLSYVPAWLELTSLPALQQMSFGVRLAVTAFGSAAVWVPVMLLTEPESRETLEGFYRRARPGGPGWIRFRRRLRLEPVTELGGDLTRTLLGAMALFGAMFAVGGTVLLDLRTAVLCGVLSLAGLAGLVRLGRGGRGVGGQGPARSG